MLYSLKDYIIQEETENESKRSIKNALFYDSLLQSPASSPYCVLVEFLAPDVFCSSYIRYLHFLFFFPAAMPLVFPSVTAWAALAFQSFN